MREYSEVFVAFDVAKTKHAVAVAEAGRACPGLEPPAIRVSGPVATMRAKGGIAH